MYQSKKFNSQSEYEWWLGEVGNTVRIVSATPQRKTWSLLTGFMNLENAEVISVTYEVLEGFVEPEKPKTQLQPRNFLPVLIFLGVAILLAVIVLLNVKIQAPAAAPASDAECATLLQVYEQADTRYNELRANSKPGDVFFNELQARNDAYNKLINRGCPRP